MLNIQKAIVAGRTKGPAGFKVHCDCFVWSHKVSIACPILTSPAGNAITIGTADQAVIALAAHQRVITNASIHCIRQIATGQNIGQRIARDREGLSLKITCNILNILPGQAYRSAPKQDQISPLASCLRE